MSDQVKLTPATIKAACKEMLSHQSIVDSFTLKYKQVCEVKKSEKKIVYVPLCDTW